MVLRYALLGGIVVVGFVILAALLPSPGYAALGLSGAALSVAVIGRQRRRGRPRPAEAQVGWVSPAALWSPLGETQHACFSPASLAPSPARARTEAAPGAEPRQLALEIAGTVSAMSALDVVVELSDDGGGQAARFITLWECLTAAAHPAGRDDTRPDALLHLAAELVATDASADVFPVDGSGAGEAFIVLFGRLEGLVAGVTKPADPSPCQHPAMLSPGTPRTGPGGRPHR